nr:hypothetical protein [Enterococcus faecium]
MIDKTIKELAKNFMFQNKQLGKGYQLILEKTMCKLLLGTE